MSRRETKDWTRGEREAGVVHFDLALQRRVRDVNSRRPTPQLGQLIPPSYVLRPVVVVVVVDRADVVPLEGPNGGDGRFLSDGPGGLA